MKTCTITFTEQEVESSLIQLGARLDDLKKLAEESKDFHRIIELVNHIAPIQSAHQKLLEARFV